MPLEPWRPTHALESPIWKINRAKKHIETLNRYVEQWEALGPINLLIELDETKAFWECRLQATIPPFLDIGHLLGEFAYQLRSALDQMVFSLCEFEGRGGQELEKAERSVSFPILLEPNAQEVSKRLKYVPAPIRHQTREVIESVQPYQNGARARLDALAILNEMNIRDKHRVLRPPGSGLAIDRRSLGPGVEIAEGSANDGEVIARVPVNLDPHAELNRRFTRHLLIPLRQPEAGLPINWIVNVYGRVAFDVLPLFAGLHTPLPPTVNLPKPEDP